MLAATLLLLARCAEPDFCPTEVELKRAVREYRETAEMAFFLSLSDEERGGTTLTPWPAVIRISDLSCGAPSPDEQPSVLCHVALRFAKGAEQTSFRLRRCNGVWKVVEEVSH